jgi:hypothetical protein
MQGQPSPIPRALRWLLVALALQLVVDLGTLTLGEHGAPDRTALEVGALFVDGLVLALLARATELTRTLLRTAAGVGMAIDAWILLGVITWAPRDPAGVTMLATSLGLVAASAFAWVVLGREDVKAWVFARWLARQPLDEPERSASDPEGARSRGAAVPG